MIEAGSALVAGLLGTSVMWMAWEHERRKRADFETDLNSLIHAGLVDTDDLRRTVRYKSVRQSLVDRHPADRTPRRAAEAVKEADPENGPITIDPATGREVDADGE
ncbi:hypothetical protein [Haloparvum sedimenti]|uniref:hypothetical protein n=1 Tax=Haloparvum sedimenti TaxID=1678448 RepID=UPI00071E9A7D|nr:hypothetical protein [Haloparvum sedimenti]